MQKGNIVDLINYREEREASSQKSEANGCNTVLSKDAISHDLITAIQNLIKQLRESGPIADPCA